MNEHQAFETVLRYVRAMAEYGPLAPRLRKRGREGFEAVVLEAATRLYGNLPHRVRSVRSLRSRSVIAAGPETAALG